MHLQPLGAYDPDPRSPGLVRAAARGCLGGEVGEDELDLVLLAISELATNAVRHARSTFEVRLGHDGACVRFEIDDDDATVPSPRRPEPTDVSGRGLLLVGTIADAWGIEPRPPGKTVWFERIVEPVTGPAAAGSPPAGRTEGRP